jgi:hypothetical protein
MDTIRNSYGATGGVIWDDLNLSKIVSRENSQVYRINLLETKRFLNTI